MEPIVEGNVLTLRRFAGTLSLLVVTLVLAIAWYTNRKVQLGFKDSDNAEVMVRFIRLHTSLYEQQGHLFSLLGITAMLLVALLFIETKGDAPVLALLALAFGVIGGGFLFLVGLMFQNSGTMLHMRGLQPEWGESAYIAMQITIDAFGRAGGSLLGAWVFLMSLVVVRSGFVPRILGYVGLLSMVALLLALTLLWTAWFVVFVLVGAWFLGLGVALLWSRTSKHSRQTA